MTEENFKYILEECIKAHNNGIVKQFFLEISGGEPFLAFNMFSKVIPYYKEKYPEIFKFSTATNITIINNEIVEWIKKYFEGRLCVSVDSLKFSKPINGLSSSNLQIENIKKLRKAGIRVSCISVFDSQEEKEMVSMAEFAVENFSHWRILLAKPIKHTKEQILKMAKPVIQYLYKHNYYSPENSKNFDFEGWDLYNERNVAGCPCGRKLLGIMPDLEVIPGNGEEVINLGKFNSDIILNPYKMN
jgi:sulfatase maturation enzyme AslB (radical SAM superfamily)